MTDAIAAFQLVLAALDRMEIPYYVCGSMASANYGFPRQTNDIDIVVDFQVAELKKFCRLLPTDLYVEGDNFIAIHRSTILKFDFFPCDGTPFARKQLERRVHRQSSMPGMESLEFAVCTAEDSVLSKLEWFREGGQSSSQQWTDIPAILQVQDKVLNYEYLREWAAKLELTELLEKAFSSARPSLLPGRAPSSEPVG